MGSYNSRRMDDNDLHSRSGSEDDSDYETEHQYAALLQSLINSGQVEIMDADYITLDGPKVPKIKFKPNTTVLDKSEFSLSTRMASGLGQSSRKITSSENISNMLLNREKGMCPYRSFSYAHKCKLSNRFLPNSMSVLDIYNGKVFCGIFSKDGKTFITASQDRQIRLYKADDSSYKLFNTLSARDIGWSIIDVAISPDQNQFLYSTWSSSLHLCSLNESSHQEPLCLSRTSRRFCVFSVVFSSDGKEFLGGANDGCLYIYDLQSHAKVKIPAHEYDVNSVAYADSSSHIIYSGGDDGLIKVWDRRTLGESSVKPVGVLAGHMDGITFIDSRGDGRHLISNSKDQSIKLWDVRVFSGEKAAEKSLKAVHEQTWDYRWQQVPKRLFTSKDKLEGDTSIMTYRGHVVIKTLVRCRFSPLETTGQRYIYTGSGTGDLIIYDSLTGKIEEFVHGHKACVRDVSWHPYRNEILTSSWDGRVGRWTYIDKETLHQSEKERRLQSSTSGSRPQSAQMQLRRSSRLASKKRSTRAD